MAGYGTKMKEERDRKPEIFTCGVCGTECLKGLLCTECMKELQGQSAESFAKSQRGEL